MIDYLTALKHFVHVENDTQKRQIIEMWQKPISARVAEGEAIGDIEIIQRSWTQASLCCRENISKFRQADTLIRSQGTPSEGGVKRIVIGSNKLFDARPSDRKLQEWVENFRALYSKELLGIHFRYPRTPLIPGFIKRYIINCCQNNRP
jgi:hypothetical protein